MNNEQLIIQKDITDITYKYFYFSDIIFRDFIYGDPYYKTLSHFLYSFFVKYNLSLDFDYKFLDCIDIVKVVSRLYEVFISADIKFNKSNSSENYRHRKNYIHKALRRATVRLLTVEFDCYSAGSEELDKLKKFRYLSFDRDDGQFLEDISLKEWKKDRSVKYSQELKRDKIRKIIKVLNDSEKKVISLCLRGLSYEEISEKLGIDNSKVRKKFFSAKNKLVKEHDSINSFCAVSGIVR